MKLFKNLLVVILILGFAVSGCKKDKEELNYLQVGDTTIYLSDGNIKYYGNYEGSDYNFDLDFVSSNIVLSTSETNGNPVYTGTGTRIYFETYSGSATELVNGDYTFLNDQTCPAGTFDRCSYSFEYNYDALFNYISIDNGTMSFKNSDGSYVINFEGTDPLGNIVKMHYSGSLTYYDRSEDAK